MQNFKSLCSITDIQKYKERKIKKVRKCEQVNCDKDSRYNHKMQVVGAYCNEHKKPYMLDVTKNMCIQKNCYIRANYNYYNEKKGMYCNLHKLDGMIDIANKSCKTEKCNTRPSFNYKNQTNGLYCELHKLNGMIDVMNLHKQCKEIDCAKRANFNFNTETKALYCADHKKDNMVLKLSNNAKIKKEENEIMGKNKIKKYNKKCHNEKCKVRPYFNFKNENIGLYCGLHKLNDMVDVINYKCVNNNCKQFACYNYKNEKKRLYCKKHKKDNMINISAIHKLCKENNCTVIGIFNYPNIIKEFYCHNHKKENMVDVVNKVCKTDLCGISARIKKYKGYCLRCFIYNFPNDKIVRDYGTREAKVSQFIKETYTDLKITYNKVIDGGCSKNRPDIFIDCLTHSIIIEVDEHQHKAKSYTPECEISRINNLFTDLADRPIIFIRFNPDSYTNKNNKLIKSCFEYTEDKGLPKANKTLQTRLKKLKKLIDVNLNKVPTENITTIKLYYDGF